jgi:uncharacterized protein YndB with AHSA1/START domain
VQTFESDVEIARPVHEVFEALLRLDQLPVWKPGVLEIRRDGDAVGPAEVGSTGAFVGRLLGHSFESGLRYSEIVPDRLVEIETTSGPFRLSVRATVGPSGAGATSTLLRTTWTGDAHGVFRLLEGPLIAVSHQQVDNALANLQQLLESSPA